MSLEGALIGAAAYGLAWIILPSATPERRFACAVGLLVLALLVRWLPK